MRLRKAKCWVLGLGTGTVLGGQLNWMVLKVSSNLFDSMFSLISPERINFALA